MKKFACENWAESDDNFAVNMEIFENLEEIWHFFKVQKYHKILKMKNSQTLQRHQVPTVLSKQT